MNLKYITKKMMVMGLIGMLSIGCMTGCGKNSKVVFTTGLSGNQLFKIGSTTCTTPEIMIYLTTFYNQYVNIYGEEMWQYDFGNVSLEEHVKDVVLSKMAQIKIMNLMAEERKIVLNEDEKSAVEAAAEKYYELLEEDLKQQEKITKEVVKEVFAEYTLANKVYEEITESADMEISDDEARTVTVEVIYFKNWKIKNNEKTPLSESEIISVLNEAREVLDKIDEGELFDTLATQYSDDKQVVKSFSRGSVEGSFEDLLFSMDEGDVSGVIERDDGYYIVKCVSTMDYEATQQNKQVLAEQRKQEAFSEAYKEIANSTHSQFRDKQWNAISLNEEIHATDANFFEIYEEYIK